MSKLIQELIKKELKKYAKEIIAKKDIYFEIEGINVNIFHIIDGRILTTSNIDSLIYVHDFSIYKILYCK